LEYRDYKVISLTLISQVILGIFDLIGVALIGLLGTLTVNGITSQAPGSRVSQVLDILRIGNLSFQEQVAIIGSIAGTLLISKTVLSYLSAKYNLSYLSKKGARISEALVSEFFKLPITEIKKINQFELNFALGNGATLLSVGVIGSAVLLLSDVILLTIISVGLFFVDPITAISTYLYFVLIVWLLYLKMRHTARTLGNLDTHLNIQSNSRILGAINSYREVHTSGNMNIITGQIADTRFKLAKIQSSLTLLPSITKYTLESALVFGSVLLCAVHFILSDARHAFGILALFLAAGSRIAPAALRIQQSAMQIKSSLGSVEPTINLIEKLGLIPISHINSNQPDQIYENFKGKFNVCDVHFKYSEAHASTLRNINVAGGEGSFTAIVGASGSGKTTFVDILLGLIKPDQGTVEISDLDPISAIQKWPGAIAYVPQEVHLIEGTILENVCFGVDPSQIDENHVRDLLHSVRLGEWLEGANSDLNTLVGSGGLGLSGGQIQRLGIARALYASPRLLVLDEATSALDSITEAEIASTLENLKHKVTLIVIAHRLSTVINADNVVYMDKGEILGQGTFNQLKALVPNFSQQANLMGL
jgi:ATP-binding cassette subfamily C protein